MMSDGFMSRAVEISVGSLSPTINWTTLKLEEFDLPPLDQQRRIAELLWAVDEDCVTWHEERQAISAVFDSRLVNAFGSGANGGPACKVPMKALSDVASLQTGIAKGKKYPATVPTVELPYLRVANVQDGHLDLSEMKNIVIPKAEKERYLLRKDDVVICEGGDFDKVGRGAIWRGQVPNCLHQNHIFCLRADRSILIPEFLALQLGSPYGKRYFLGCAKKTSNLASINSTQVKAFPLQLPPLNDQRALVNEIEQIENAKQATARHLDASRVVLKALMESLT